MVKKPKSLFLPFKRLRKISQRIRVPPSPLKLRLIAKTVYWRVGMMINVQKMRESTPKMFSFVGGKKRKTTLRV
jgi:hypothetical protein